ncbi:MAG TPA: aldo/keto reductase [bacterium]|jgi:voltage-dependent potassium channel beta subunit
MEYRYLGKTGLQVSALSFGAWVTFGNQLDDDAAYECMDAAYKAGCNFFDNAEAYAGGKAEEIMGNVIKKAGWKRSDIIVSTKIFWGGRGPNDRGLSYKHIVEGTIAGLERLQLDYVDLLFCHRPDPNTPIEETVRAMNYCINSGRAFYWGTSEWSKEEILDAHKVARREHLIPPVMEQPQYNMFEREKVENEFAELYEDPGLGTTIWSPLNSGILTGKYVDGIPEGSRMSLEVYDWLRSMVESAEGKAKIEKVQKLMPIAEKIGCSMSQLAIAWCLKNKNVSTVITGASKVEQVDENMQAINYAGKITPAIMDEIDSILQNKVTV